MAIKQKKHRKPQIDISGPAGNAFALLGYASHYARSLGLDEAAIVADMESGSYEHLLKVFDQHFGEYVDLIR